MCNLRLNWAEILANYNCTKSKVLITVTITQNCAINYIQLTQAVEEVNQLKYLGVLIDNQLKWQQQLDHVCKKLACASYALLKFSPISTLFTFSPISTLKTVYYALVHPHLSYGRACWSNAAKKSLRKIVILQNKIVRLMAYSDQRTPAIIMVNKGLLFHMTQPTSRSIIKAIACSKPTISEHWSK